MKRPNLYISELVVWNACIHSKTLSSQRRNQPGKHVKMLRFHVWGKIFWVSKKMVLRRRRYLLRVFIRDVPHADHRREGDPLAGLGIDINLKKVKLVISGTFLFFLKKRNKESMHGLRLWLHEARKQAYPVGELCAGAQSVKGDWVRIRDLAHLAHDGVQGPLGTLRIKKRQKSKGYQDILFTCGHSRQVKQWSKLLLLLDLGSVFLEH